MKKMHAGINTSLAIVPIFAILTMMTLFGFDLIFGLYMYLFLSVLPLVISFIVWIIIKAFGGYKND